jgi:hypothetical protein
VTEHNTPRLGKPFKTVKSINFVTYDSTGQHHHAKAHLYLDSRGDAGFAIGIPQEVYDLVGEFISDDSHRDTFRVLIDTKTSAIYVKAETAAKAERMAERVYRKYKSMVDELNKAEVISIVFSALVPDYDDQGMPTGTHSVNPSRTRFGGGAGRNIDLEFSFQRGFRVGSDFICKRANGTTYKDHNASRGIEIPYTDEAWQQLTSIRETLTTAIQALYGVFGVASENIPSLLAVGLNGALALPPPKLGPDEEQVLEVFSGRLIRRKRK